MLFLLVMGALALPACRPTIAFAPTAGGPPVLAVDAPDPDVVRDGGAWYVATTRTVTGGNVPIWRATQLGTWELLGDGLPTVGPWATDHQVWAPALHRFGSTWTLFYSAIDGATGVMCIGRATSSLPSGPFVDSSSAPFACPALVGGAIDPDTFVDPLTGKTYLLWKNNFDAGAPVSGLWSVELSADGSAVVGQAQQILGIDVDWERPRIENPAMVYEHGTYWLFYSGNDWSSAWYGTGYAACSSPLGPCTKVTTRFAWHGSTDFALGPGGMSFERDEQGTVWALHHGWLGDQPGYKQGSVRGLFAQAIGFNPGPVVAGSVPLGQSEIAGALPVGNVEVVEAQPGGVLHVRGWSYDPDGGGAVEVGLHIDGALAVGGLTSVSRPDVSSVHASASSTAGFDLSVAVPDGLHRVCVTATDTGYGNSWALGCGLIATSTAPLGDVEAVTALPGGDLRFEGWALDLDQPTTALTMEVWVDGTLRATPLADDHHPSVGSWYPSAGSAHGFEATVNAGSGIHHVCVKARNVGLGPAVGELGCAFVRVGGNPIGSFEAVTVAPGSLTVRGWSIDPDVTSPVDVHVYLDGNFAGTQTANVVRHDVGQAYPEWGAFHGFELAVAATPGPHTVCVFAINTGYGDTNPLLGGCPTVLVP